MFSRIGRDNLFLMLALLLWALGEGMWFSQRNILLQELGATPPQIGFAGTMEALGRAALMIPVGFLIDRIGPRAILVAGWLIGMGSIVLMALSPTWEILTVTLAIYATTIFVIPAISAYAVMAAPNGSDPQRVLSVLYVSFPIGGIVSPVVGGILADALGSIRSLMWLSLIMYTLSTAAVFMTRHVEPHPRESDFHFSQLLRNKLFVRYSIFFSVAFVAMWVSMALLPNFLNQSRGFTKTEIGVYYSVLSLGTVVLNIVLGRSPKRIVFLLTMGTFWLAILILWQVGLPLGIWLGAVLSGTVYFLRPSVQARLEDVIRPHERGLAYSGMEVLFALATGVAAGAAGQLFDQTAAHDLPFIASIIGIPLVIAGWFALRIAPGHEPQITPLQEGSQ